MTNIIVKIICAILCSITIVYTTKTILNQKCKLRDFKTILLVILIAAITYLSYGIQYNTDSTILRFVLYIVAIKIMIGKSIYKTILVTFISVFLMSVCDLILSLALINFVTIQQVRGTIALSLFCNIFVSFMTIIIIRIPIIKCKICDFINKINERGKTSNIFLFLLSVIVMIYTFYNISLNYNWSEKYIINVIIIVTYIIIIIIFLRDRLEYNALVDKYDNLFDYFKDFENSIDEVSLINHEYKNQLAVLKGYLEANKKKDAEKYLNDIINDLDTEDKTVISELKNIPKGGIKGLLYYKIITAQNKNVKVVLDINDNLEKKLKVLDYEKNKIISKVLGVYIDNAIDAAATTNKKVITIEIYCFNDEINFVISNKFKRQRVKLDKISKKGYTTKGKGHGRGLYLITKIINKLDWFKTETKIINNYFVQRVIINTKKVH